MKILHIANVLNPGGAENHLQHLVGALRRHNHAVDIAYVKHGMGRLASDFRALGCTVFPLGAKSSIDPRPIFALAKLLRQKEYDLIHSHLPRADWLTVLARRMSGTKTPLISSKHNEHDFLLKPHYRAIERRLSADFQHTIAISHSVKKFFLDNKLTKHPERMQVIHYGINVDQFRERVEKQSKRSHDQLRIGVVARLVPQKGLNFLITAFASIANTHQNVRLVIVGQGKLLGQLKEQVAHQKLDTLVEFAGFQEDVATWMDSFDIFVLPSLWEGFGLVLLEAMALGKPIVTTNVGPIPEIVRQGETGLLVAPSSSEALAQALTTLIERDEYRKQLGEAGLRRVCSEFTVERMVTQTLTLYERAVK